MRKILVILISLVCLVGMQAQNSKEISGGLVYSGLSGLNLEVGGRLSLNHRWGIGASAASNFSNSISFRSGLDYRFIQKNRFYASIGLGYHFESYKFNKSPSWQNHNLEIPLSIGFMLTNQFGIIGAVIPAINGNNDQNNYFIDNIRLGMTYSW